VSYLILVLGLFALDPAVIEKAKSADSFERSDAARALGKDGSPEAARLLVSLIADRNPYVRDHAVVACGSVKDETAVKILAAGMGSKSDLTRLNTAEALGRTRSPAALRSLSLLSRKDRSPRVRARALDWMWGWREHPQALAVAVTAYEDRHPLVRAAAVETAGRLRGDDAKALVSKALEDEDEGVRCVARLELRYLDRPAALAGLAAAAGDGSWRIRAQTVEDALYLRDREAVDALVRLIGDDVLRISAAAHRALVSLSGKEIGRDRDLWEAWWKANREKWKPPKGRLAAKKAGADGKSVARFHGVEVTSDRLAFVLDLSGSMAKPMPGDEKGRSRWEFVTAELSRTLDALPRGTSVTVIVFAERVEKTGPLALTSKSRKPLAAFAAKQTPGKRGDLLGAMNAALDLEGIDTIFLLTDGAPSHGEVVDKSRVRSLIRQRNRMLKRAIHAIGFGSVKDGERKFMEGVARESGGTVVFR
jgi:HEAT repeat protein